MEILCRVELLIEILEHEEIRLQVKEILLRNLETLRDDLKTRPTEKIPKTIEK